MANLNDIVNELQTTNAKVDRVADILEQQKKQDKAQEDAAKREKAAADEDDKKKGGLNKSISNAFKKPVNGFKKITDGFMDPLKNFFEVLLKTLILDFVSDPAKMAALKNNLQKFGDFIKDTYAAVTGFMDKVEKEGLLKAMNETFGPGGTLLAAAGVVTAIGLAVSGLLAPLKFIKKGFSGIGRVLKSVAFALASAAGLQAPVFADPEKLYKEKLKELTDADKRGLYNEKTGKVTVLDKQTGQLKEIDRYTASGKEDPRARASMAARENRIADYKNQARAFTNERVNADTGERQPTSKNKKMLEAIKRWTKLAGPLAAVSAAGISGYSIYNILDNDKIPYAEKEKLIAKELGAGLGGLTGSIVGGVIGGISPVPGGAIMGAIGGGLFGAQGGEMLANWILSGQMKQQVRPKSQVEADLGFQEDLGMSGFNTTPKTATETAPIFNPGPQATGTVNVIPDTSKLSPVAEEMLSKADSTSAKSFNALYRSGLGLQNDTMIQILMDIDQKLGAMGMNTGGNISPYINVNRQNYVLSNAQTNTSDPNK